MTQGSAKTSGSGSETEINLNRLRTVFLPRTLSAGNHPQSNLIDPHGRTISTWNWTSRHPQHVSFEYSPIGSCPEHHPLWDSQNETHLTLGHAGLEFVNHTLTDNVPLLYGNPVYSRETYGGTAALYCQND